MKKIVHVISDLQMGGAEEVAVQLATAHARTGAQCCVATVTSKSPNSNFSSSFRERLTSAGVQLCELGGKSTVASLSVAPVKLARLIWLWKPDLVHSHTDIPDLVVSIARRLLPFAVARTIHNVELWPTHFWIGLIAERRFKDDLVIAVSGDTLDAYKRLRVRYRLPCSTSLRLIRNATSLRDRTASADRTRLATEFSADTDKLLLCFAGRYEDQKGFDILLHSLELLPPEYVSKIQVHAFGSGSREAEYRTATTKGRLPVHFHAPVPGLSKFFSSFDAIIMPSRFEGAPMVAIESLCEGALLVPSLAKGLREAVPENWPLAFAPEAFFELRDLLKRLVDGEIDRDTLIGASYDWARNKFSSDRMCDEYANAYDEYLDA